MFVINGVLSHCVYHLSTGVCRSHYKHPVNEFNWEGAGLVSGNDGARDSVGIIKHCLFGVSAFIYNLHVCVR